MENQISSTPDNEIPADVINGHLEMTDFLSNTSAKGWTGLPEAPGIAFTKMYYTVHFDDGTTEESEINITSRAINSIEALDDLMTTMSYARKQYGMYMSKKFQGVSSVQKSADSSQAPQAPDQNNSFSGEAQKPTSGTFKIKRIAVTPGADGKTKIEMYAENHKYPDLYMKMSPDQLASVFSQTGAWTKEHFEKATNYSVDYEVSWKNSERKTSQGNFYKDVVGIVKA